jgi:glycosyltransferase involved in cell wall biosynthesis
LGSVSHDELPYIIAASDTGIAPFNDAYYPPLRRFGFFWAPTKVLEYAAGGLPIVSADYPILDELIIDGETGILVEPGNPAAFATAILELAGDAERRDGMGRRGEAHVKSNFRWDVHNEILERFIIEAIKDRR